MLSSLQPLFSQICKIDDGTLKFLFNSVKHFISLLLDVHVWKKRFFTATDMQRISKRSEDKQKDVKEKKYDNTESTQDKA